MNARKVLVVGNATIDAYLKSVSYQIKDNTAHLKDENSGIETKIECVEELRSGGKHFAKQHLYFALQGFSYEERFGGGGVNSVRELSAIVNWDISYLDMSTPSLDTSKPGRTLAGYLAKLGITPIFLSTRPIPLNLVLGTRHDKIVLKSPLLQQVELWEKQSDLQSLLSFIVHGLGYNAILFNSVKDVSLAEYIVSSIADKMAVITRSLPPDFVIDRVLPFCLCQFNYDEFGYILYNRVIGDENDRFQAAVEGLDQLRLMRRLQLPVVVTLGKNGALIATKRETYHIRLQEDKLDQVQNYLKGRTSQLTGAGDAFAAHSFRAWLLNANSVDIAIAGNIGAVKFLGYKALNKDDFVIAEIGVRKPKLYLPLEKVF